MQGGPLLINNLHEMTISFERSSKLDHSETEKLLLNSVRRRRAESFWVRIKEGPVHWHFLLKSFKTLLE